MRFEIVFFILTMELVGNLESKINYFLGSLDENLGITSLDTNLGIL
jgi:hypothetical protein